VPEAHRPTRTNRLYSYSFAILLYRIISSRKQFGRIVQILYYFILRFVQLILVFIFSFYHISVGHKGHDHRCGHRTLPVQEVCTSIQVISVFFTYGTPYIDIHRGGALRGAVSHNIFHPCDNAEII